MMKLKGIAASTVIITLVIVAGVIVVCLLLGKGGMGLGGGKGDGIGSKEAVAADITLPETDITTGSIDYYDVTVSGSSYLFNGSSYEMDETDRIIADISGGDELLTVRITDEDASLKAYECLTEAFKENGIRYIEFP